MEFTLMIRQEQGKKNHHKEEILINSSTTHTLLGPSSGSAVVCLFSTLSLPSGLDWQKSSFCLLVAVQTALIQYALCCCASLEKEHI